MLGLQQRQQGILGRRFLLARQARTLAEAELERCRKAAEDPAIASDAARLHERFAALAAAQAEVERLYARWAELEATLA